METAIEFGKCVFCKRPIAGKEDKTSYGHDPLTMTQTYAHWDCYHEALNARIGAIEKEQGDG